MTVRVRPPKIKPWILLLVVLLQQLRTYEIQYWSVYIYSVERIWGEGSPDAKIKMHCW